MRMRRASIFNIFNILFMFFNKKIQQSDSIENLYFYEKGQFAENFFLSSIYFCFTILAMMCNGKHIYPMLKVIYIFQKFKIRRILFIGNFYYDIN